MGFGGSFGCRHLLRERWCRLAGWFSDSCNVDRQVHRQGSTRCLLAALSVFMLLNVLQQKALAHHISSAVWPRESFLFVVPNMWMELCFQLSLSCICISPWSMCISLYFSANSWDVPDSQRDKAVKVNDNKCWELDKKVAVLHKCFILFKMWFKTWADRQLWSSCQISDWCSESIKRS